jgi:hypothetical protein
MARTGSTDQAQTEKGGAGAAKFGEETSRKTAASAAGPLRNEQQVGASQSWCIISEETVENLGGTPFFRPCGQKPPIEFAWKRAFGCRDGSLYREPATSRHNWQGCQLVGGR